MQGRTRGLQAGIITPDAVQHSGVGCHRHHADGDTGLRVRLRRDSEHPHGSPDKEFDAIFGLDKSVIFAHHGYPWLVHRLTYSRSNHRHVHVRGFKERGTTTTPFDMVMLNDLDRFHLVMDVIDRLDGLAGHAAVLRQRMSDARRYTRQHGEDDPAISGRTWTDG